jgi:hypothetical protein
VPLYFPLFVPSVRVIPFHSEPYTICTHHLTHVSDGSNVAREGETINQTREVASQWYEAIALWVTVFPGCRSSSRGRLDALNSPPLIHSLPHEACHFDSCHVVQGFGLCLCHWRLTFIPLLLISVIAFTIYTSVPVNDTDVSKQAKENAELHDSDAAEAEESSHQTHPSI